MPPRQKPAPTSLEKAGESVAAPTQPAKPVVEVPFVNPGSKDNEPLLAATFQADVLSLGRTLRSDYELEM